ncbi:NAD-binding protein [Candidatus Saccharibacteria bacterium]|nr:NAD-binding protein [Candidatus Saccharibacteria bacterium]
MSKKRSTLKYFDVILIGDDPFLNLLDSILKTYKVTTHRYSGREFNFIDGTNVAIEGTRMSADGIAVSFRNPQIEKVKSRHTVVSGNDTNSVATALRLVNSGAKVTLMSYESLVLPKYDISVQKMMTKLLAKRAVRVIHGAEIIKTDYDQLNKITRILGEFEGRPIRLSADYFYQQKSDEVDVSVFKKCNVADDMVSIFDDRVALLSKSHKLTIEESFRLARFLAKKGSWKKSGANRYFELDDNISFFSIGINEQDYESTHLGYRSSLVKVNVPGDGSSAWFIKLLTSRDRHIIGAHGILPYRYENLDLLISLVEQHAHVDKLKASCLISDKLSKEYIELINNL